MNPLEKEVLFEDFDVIPNEGKVIEYRKTDTEDYSWALTQSGCLLVYKREKHETFGAVLRDGRIRAFAPGTWFEVRVVEQQTDSKK